MKGMVIGMAFSHPEFIVAAILFIAAGAIISARYISHRKNNKPVIPEQPGVPAISTVDPGYEILYGREKRVALTKFKEKYDRLFSHLNIPGDAHNVVKCTSMFSLEHVCVDHYAWNDGEALCFFPKWRSIAHYLLDPEYLHRHSENEADILFGWRIPSGGLEHYNMVGDNDIVAVVYSDSAGKKYSTTFLDGAGSFFKSLFPEKDYAILERKTYLSSQKNIYDIKSEMAAIEEKMNNGDITPDEYAYEKWRLLRRM